MVQAAPELKFSNPHFLVGQTSNIYCVGGSAHASGARARTITSDSRCSPAGRSTRAAEEDSSLASERKRLKALRTSRNQGEPGSSVCVRVLYEGADTHTRILHTGGRISASDKRSCCSAARPMNAFGFRCSRQRAGVYCFVLYASA